ncbi:MAG: AP2 domain-containing protein [Clostridia bacterium]
MATKINRTGETGVNNFGSEIVITGYRNTRDIDVYFPEYNWTAKNRRYDNFKNGKISCPYERKVYGVGYIGEGEYKVRENGKITRVYDTWHSMIQRCYDEKYHEIRHTYIGCTVDKEWHNFQNFAEWYDRNYYKIKGEIMHLDKDILVKHNKIYSPDTCVFVPQKINTLFIKCDKSRGESVIGTSSLKNGKYIVHCSMINPVTGESKGKHLGIYETQEKAFEVYKYYKERNIKEVADYFKEHIPQRLYDGMYKYEVEITD